MILINLHPRAVHELCVVHLELAEANAFVARSHRHSGKVRGHRFSLGAQDRQGRLVGVAICGRPNARGLDYTTTLDVSRVCTDGTRNACSYLYGASVRAARALGFLRVVTYIEKGESGASLSGGGFRKVADVDGALSWSRQSRPRPQQGSMFDDPRRTEVDRERWEVIL